MFVLSIGVETSPDNIFCIREVHISGDISYAMQQYLLATGDTDILNNSSYKAVVFGIADFWISRLQYNNTSQLFDINGKCIIALHLHVNWSY